MKASNSSASQTVRYLDDSSPQLLVNVSFADAKAAVGKYCCCLQPASNVGATCALLPGMGPVAEESTLTALRDADQRHSKDGFLSREWTSSVGAYDDYAVASQLGEMKSCRAERCHE